MVGAHAHHVSVCVCCVLTGYLLAFGLSLLYADMCFVVHTIRTKRSLSRMGFFHSEWFNVKCTDL